MVAAVGALHRVADREFDVAAAKGGLLDHVGELVRRQQVAEVGERAVHGRDGNALVAREVARIEPAAAVDLDAVERTKQRRNDRNQRASGSG